MQLLKIILFFREFLNILYMKVWGSFLQGGNNIHAEGVTALAEALKDNSIITFVSPSSFYLFFSFLYLNVTTYNSLSSLSFSQLEVGYNPIGPDGVKALSEVLKFNGNIETLKLGWCQVIYGYGP